MSSSTEAKSVSSSPPLDAQSLLLSDQVGTTNQRKEITFFFNAKMYAIIYEAFP